MATEEVKIRRRMISLERFVRRFLESTAHATEDMPSSIHMAGIEAFRREGEAVLEGKFIDNPDPHYHEAYYDSDGNLTDMCARCGRDLRDELHSAEAIAHHSGITTEQPTPETERP